MLLALRLLLLRWLAARSLGGVVAGILAVVLPSAAALKVLGVPVLAVAMFVGAPVAALLGVVGLPVAIVAGVVGVVALLAVGAAVLGMFLLKYVLPVALVVWLVSRLFRTINRRAEEVDARRSAAAAADSTYGMDGMASSGPVTEAPIV